MSFPVMTALSIGAQKLGHPVPLSNFVSTKNFPSAQPARAKPRRSRDQRARKWRLGGSAATPR
jgi:hypothetical protein